MYVNGEKGVGVQKEVSFYPQSFTEKMWILLQNGGCLKLMNLEPAHGSLSPKAEPMQMSDKYAIKYNKYIVFAHMDLK